MSANMEFFTNGNGHRPSQNNDQPLIVSTEMGKLAILTSMGNKRAEIKLMKELYETARNHLQRKLQNVDDLNDVLQDTLELTLNKVRNGALTNPDSVKSFTIGVADRVASGFFRRAQRERNMLTPLNEDSAVYMSADNASPPVKIEQDIWRQEISEKLKRLKKQRDRLFMIRFYYHGESVKSIASHFSISEEHGFRVLHRARKRLKALISPAFVESC